MQSHPIKHVILAALALAGANLLADTVDVKGGARIVGKITKIDAGSVVVSTDYAGTITIKQSEVTGLSTDAPVSVRLATGTRLDGKLTAGSGGAVTIAGSDGTLNTTVDKVAASWAAGAKDPAVVALERSWAYEAAVDVTGKTGNKEQLGTAASLRATLKTAQDTLQFYSAYDRQVVDGTKSADQFKAGVDYQNNFKGRWSWYVRDEGGFDRVKNIELYNVAAFGMGYDAIKESSQTLTLRGGLSYRYEGYRDLPPPAQTPPDVNSAGLDFGLAHTLSRDNWKLVNRLSYVPTFEDFQNYKATHESFFEIPLVAPHWKLRLGVSNDYSSQPGRGVDKLDTSYFTRFVLNWQ